MNATLTRTEPRFDFDTLVSLVGGGSGNELALRFGVTRRTIERWRSRGLSLDAADRAALHIGRNIEEVWPEHMPAAAPSLVVRLNCPGCADTLVVDAPPTLALDGHEARVGLACPDCGPWTATVTLEAR